MKRIFFIIILLLFPYICFGADVKITSLAEDLTPDYQDLLIVIDDPSGTPITKKTTIGNAIVGGLNNLGITKTGTVVSINDSVDTDLIITPAITAPVDSLVIKPTTDATTAIQVQDKDGTVIGNFDTVNDRLGVGTISPTSKLHIIGDLTLGNTDATGYNNLLLYEEGNIQMASGSSGTQRIWFHQSNRIIFEVDSKAIFETSMDWNLGSNLLETNHQRRSDIDVVFRSGVDGQNGYGFIFDSTNGYVGLGVVQDTTNGDLPLERLHINGTLRIDNGNIVQTVGTYTISATDVDDTCAYSTSYQWHRLTSGADATADTLTLAAGTIDGEMRTFTMVVDGGDNIVIDVSAGTDTTFTAAGNSVDYMWDATNSTWWIK